MMSSGRISLLVSRDLQAIVTVAKGLPREVAAQLRKHTRRVVEPAFREEVTGRAGTRLEQRVLADTARVSVRDNNVVLKSATVGKVHGTPAAELAGAAEFGMNPNRPIRQRSRKGKVYTRRAGAAFRAPKRGGYVFHPAVSDFIARAAALWAQTVYRTTAEEFEKVTS